MAKSYIPNRVHRNATPGKSQWTLSENDEQVCFWNCDKLGWIADTIGWGLHDVEGTIDYVGTDRNGNPAAIAKFIDSASNGVWHGFPASPIERPSELILAAWLKQDLLRAKAVRNISRGIRCTL